MASTKEFFKNLKLSDAQKVSMSPEEIARIEAALEELKNIEFATAHLELLRARRAACPPVPAPAGYSRDHERQN